MSHSHGPSPRVIQVIQGIKDSVERPHRCRWLQNLESEDGKRARTRRYRDGAIKIMDLLRPELTSSDIRSYQWYYERLRDLPEAWSGERLQAAKWLWEYVLYLDERLSHDRITSVPYETEYQDDTHRARHTHRHSPHRRRVRFLDPDATPQAAAARAEQPAAAPAAVRADPPPRPTYYGSLWTSGNCYSPNWRATWSPIYHYGYGSPYNRWGNYWHSSPSPYTRVWG